MTAQARPLSVRSAGFVLIAGAVLYALAVGAVGLTFSITPLAVGLAAIAAGLIGNQRRLVPIGLALAGWGSGVLLASSSLLPRGRTAPVYLIGMAVGLLAANAVARRWDLSLTGALLTALNGGVGFYLAYDFEAFDDWPLWTVLVCAWGIFELFRPAEVPSHRVIPEQAARR